MWLGGLLFLVGPPRSGTTTTGLALLQALSTPDIHSATIESERGTRYAGITQTYRDPKRGVTVRQLADSLRHMGTQVLLIDRLDEAETAWVAVEQAEAGVSVAVTLTAATLSLALQRLQHWGLSESRLWTVCQGLLFQRLGRCLCVECREEYTPTEHEKQTLNRVNPDWHTAWRATGCSTCHNTGFRGQTGVFGCLPDADNFIYADYLFRGDLCAKVQHGIVPLSEAARLLR